MLWQQHLSNRACAARTHDGWRSMTYQTHQGRHGSTSAGELSIRLYLASKHDTSSQAMQSGTATPACERWKGVRTSVRLQHSTTASHELRGAHMSLQQSDAPWEGSSKSPLGRQGALQRAAVCNAEGLQLGHGQGPAGWQLPREAVAIQLQAFEVWRSAPNSQRACRQGALGDLLTRACRAIQGPPCRPWPEKSKSSKGALPGALVVQVTTVQVHGTSMVFWFQPYHWPAATTCMHQQLMIG